MKSMLIVFTLLAAGSLMGQSPGETTGNITFAPHSTFVSHIAVASFSYYSGNCADYQLSPGFIDFQRMPRS